jgi:uncharacterized DUF497 family protein
MDHFRITQTAAGFHVEGFPDASKVIRISGPKDSSSQGEQRFVSIGMNVFGRLRVVVYALRGDDARIISVRKAEPKEIRAYEKGV